MGKTSTEIKNGETKSPVQANASPPQLDTASTKQDDSIKPESSITKAEPLAPPPRPEPTSNAPDYFSGTHAPTHPLTTEPNPFESSFAGGGTFTTNANGEVQTPGGTKLPSVAALTSPANFQTGTPGFWSSLRSGPLSPAMLSGPQKAAEDYFTDGHHLRGGFPTPNESGLRSGLTPGGSGSMFPEPSPGIFGHLPSGVATPATLDFHRTAVNAAAVAQREAPTSNITSQPQELHNGISEGKPAQGQFDQHEANDAANGLFLLANARNNNTQQPAHYAMAPQMSVHGHPQPAMSMGSAADSSPQMSNQHNGSISTTSGRGVSEVSDDNEQQNRPNTRGKGKRGSTQVAQTNIRRKADEPPSKAPAGKKAKANSGHAVEPEPPSDDDDLDTSKDEYTTNGKKMTDEEKRKNFLERNRVAALKCRQRKKQWLANLQTKVEAYSQENEGLHGTIAQLQNEIVNLKTLLLAHKDCPGQPGQNLIHQQQIMDYGQQVNPYGVAAMNNQLMTAGQGMPQRRFS